MVLISRDCFVPRNDAKRKITVPNTVRVAKINFRPPEKPEAIPQFLKYNYMKDNTKTSGTLISGKPEVTIKCRMEKQPSGKSFDPMNQGSLIVVYLS